MESPRKKNYFIDTNVIIENPACVETLRNGRQNNVYVPKNVLFELDNLKKDPSIAHVANRAGKAISAALSDGSAMPVPEMDVKARGAMSGKVDDMFADVHPDFGDTVDMYILREILMSGVKDPILVTNDRMFTTIAETLTIPVGKLACEPLRDSIPFLPESRFYTGIQECDEDVIPNSFCWDYKDGKKVLIWRRTGRERELAVSTDALAGFKIWGVSPRTAYQRMALEMFLEPDLPLVTIQSAAGYGKTFLALATALYLALELKNNPHTKIYVVKPLWEIGSKMGYLPGDVEEKMSPYVRYIMDLLRKLHEQRPANRLFADPDSGNMKLNPNKFEILPIAFIRGMNLENAVVIIDEMQNLSRNETRALLTRMGEGVKCFCLGDTRQVDNHYLNESNNGLNWVVKKFKGKRNYAHIVLKGEHSRGPITDLVLKTGL